MKSAGSYRRQAMSCHIQSHKTPCTLCHSSFYQRETVLGEKKKMSEGEGAGEGSHSEGGMHKKWSIKKMLSLIINLSSPEHCWRRLIQSSFKKWRRRLIQDVPTRRISFVVITACVSPSFCARTVCQPNNLNAVITPPLPPVVDTLLLAGFLKSLCSHVVRPHGGYFSASVWKIIKLYHLWTSEEIRPQRLLRRRRG